MQRASIFIFDSFFVTLLLVWSITCPKMVKNVDQCLPGPEMTSSHVLCCPQLKRYAVYCQRGVKQKCNENYDDDVYQNSCQIIELLKSNRLNDELVQGGVPLGLYVAWEASPKANYSLHYSCTSERTVRISTLLFIRMVSEIFLLSKRTRKNRSERDTNKTRRPITSGNCTLHRLTKRGPKTKKINLLSDMSGTHMLSMFRLVMKNSVPSESAQCSLTGTTAHWPSTVQPVLAYKSSPCVQRPSENNTQAFLF